MLVLLGACAEQAEVVGDPYGFLDPQHGFENPTEPVPYADGMQVSTETGHHAVALTLSGGGQVGTHDVALTLLHHGEPEDVESVTVRAHHLEVDLETDDLPGTSRGSAGEYLVEGLTLDDNGDWAIEVDVTESDHGGLATFLVIIEDAAD